MQLERCEQKKKVMVFFSGDCFATFNGKRESDLIQFMCMVVRCNNEVSLK